MFCFITIPLGEPNKSTIFHTIYCVKMKRPARPSRLSCLYNSFNLCSFFYYFAVHYSHIYDIHVRHDGMYY